MKLEAYCKKICMFFKPDSDRLIIFGLLFFVYLVNFFALLWVPDYPFFYIFIWLFVPMLLGASGFLMGFNSLLGILFFIIELAWLYLLVCLIMGIYSFLSKDKKLGSEFKEPELKWAKLKTPAQTKQKCSLCGKKANLKGNLCNSCYKKEHEKLKIQPLGAKVLGEKLSWEK